MENIRIEQNVQDKKKWPGILGVNSVYLIVLLLMVSVPLIISNQDPDILGTGEYYLRLFILELVLVGVPPLIYMLIFKMDIKEVIRLNKIRIKEILLIIGMAILGYGIIIILNLIWYWIISHLGTPTGQELPPVTNGTQLLLAVLTIGLVPAVVEEFLFRGLIIRGYERFGAVSAIIITGVLFGVLHIQLMTIPSIILLGIAISYVVYRTNSLFAGIIYHFTHNTITILFLFLQNILIEFAGGLESMPQQGLSELPQEIMVFAYIFWGIVGFVALVLFMICIIYFHRCTEGKGKVRAVDEKEKTRPIWMEFLPVVIAIGFVVYLVINEVRYMMGII